MNIGFYYHVGSVSRDGSVVAPGHMAMFVTELARRAGSVTYYGHSGPPSDRDDTHLDPATVRGVSLGPRAGALARTLTPRRWVRNLDLRDHGVEVLLVRAPTPLLPSLMQAAPVAAALLVGDYSDWRPSRVSPSWRNLAVAAWVKMYGLRQRRALRGRLVLANSSVLADRAASSGARVEEVFTSSLSERDLTAFARPARDSTWDAVASPTRILYTGRLSEEKGLLEAIQAVGHLVDRGWNAHFDIVGAADDERFEDTLRAEVRHRRLVDRVRLHGYRTPGRDLQEMYRSGDIFLMPSRAESFPRSLFEAMASGMPIVAARVGGIPGRLVDGESAILVEPGSPASIADGLEALLRDPALRRKLATRTRSLAEGYTNERSCKLILEHLHQLMRDVR